jgi:hypothetical protein
MASLHPYINLHTKRQKNKVAMYFLFPFGNTKEIWNDDFIGALGLASPSVASAFLHNVSYPSASAVLPLNISMRSKFANAWPEH